MPQELHLDQNEPSSVAAKFDWIVLTVVGGLLLLVAQFWIDYPGI